MSTPSGLLVHDGKHSTDSNSYHSPDQRSESSRSHTTTATSTRSWAALAASNHKKWGPVAPRQPTSRSWASLAPHSRKWGGVVQVSESVAPSSSPGSGSQTPAATICGDARSKHHGAAAPPDRLDNSLQQIVPRGFRAADNRPDDTNAPKADKGEDPRNHSDCEATTNAAAQDGLASSMPVRIPNSLVIRQLRAKEVQLKSDNHKLKGENTFLRAENQHLHETLEAISLKLKCITQAYEEAKILSEYRGQRLLAAQMFLTETDSLSMSELVQKMDALKGDIHQLAASSRVAEVRSRPDPGEKQDEGSNNVVDAEAQIQDGADPPPTMSISTSTTSQCGSVVDVQPEVTPVGLNKQNATAAGIGTRPSRASTGSRRPPELKPYGF